MDDTTLEALEYPEVLNELKGFTSTPLGAESVLGLRPSADYSVIEAGYEELKELSFILGTTGPLPLGSVGDIRPLLNKTGPEGFFFECPELLQIKLTLEALLGLRTVLTDAFCSLAPLTAGRIGSISDYRGLLKELNAIVDVRGEIKDTASSALSSLRKEIVSTRRKARSVVERLAASSKFKESLEGETLYTIRDDRHVLCVAVGRHTRFPGVLHGRSGSGSTYYIEPFEAVELNNRLQIVKKEEKAEEIKILKRAAGLISAEREALFGDLGVVAVLDTTQAKARFKEHLGGVLPEINPSAPLGRVRLLKARHPLLVFKHTRGGGPVTPVDILLDEGCAVLVISGANTGGKTVAIKTLGLLSLMIQSSMAVPAQEGSETLIFDNVFADIGDRQDIGESLSTFSAHLKRTGEILDRAGPSTLVLMDEIGVGTDPSEGGALALAVLESIRDRGARAAVTTHLNLVKAHAHSDPSFRNASVLFDEKTLRPLYRILYGTPGASHALTVAKILGMPEEVLKNAADKLEGDEGAFIESIESLERESEDLREANERLRGLEQSKLKALTRLRGDREKMLEGARKKIEGTVKRAEEEIKGFVAAIKEEGVSGARGAAARAVSSVRDVARPLFKSSREPYVPRMGDVVDIEGTGSWGEVIGLDAEARKAELLVGGMKVWVACERLVRSAKTRSVHSGRRPGVESGVYAEAGFGPSVNLIGMRVDEALRVVERALDEAHMEGIERVEVVHGVGTGTLARAVGEYLKTNGLVKGFTSADPERGGGVTLVEVE